MAIKLPFVALQCIFLLCVAAANCSLLFLESLVPFLISPYNRIVNLELIKFAAKLLPPHTPAANCLRVLFALQLDYIFVVYCINTTQLVMRWLLCLSTLYTCYCESSKSLEGVCGMNIVMVACYACVCVCVCVCVQ